MEDILKILDVQIVLVCSFVSWGVVEAVKPLVKPRLSQAVNSSVLRVVSILTGAAAGYIFGDGIESAGVGAACGAVSCFTVAVIKKLVSKKVNVDLKEIEVENSEVGASEDS
jgi:hypothetical protein